MMTTSEMINELKKYYVTLKGNNCYIHLFGPVNFPLSIDEGRTRQVYKWYVWEKTDNEVPFKDMVEYIKNVGANRNYNSLLVYGDFGNSEKALVRVHSCCFTGDVAFSLRCDCGQQLKASFKAIAENGSGAVVYLAQQEGRGIGLYAKAITHRIQDDYGLDTFESCTVVGLEEEKRVYSNIGTIISYLRNGKDIYLLSNNPEKINGLIDSGMSIRGICPLEGFENDDNSNSLRIKKMRAQKYKIKLSV